MFKKSTGRYKKRCSNAMSITIYRNLYFVKKLFARGGRHERGKGGVGVKEGVGEGGGGGGGAGGRVGGEGRRGIISDASRRRRSEYRNT